jgi:hypothetical protein
MKVLQLVDCLRRDDKAFLPGYAVVSIKSKFITGDRGDAGAVECNFPHEQLLDSYGGDFCPTLRSNWTRSHGAN